MVRTPRHSKPKTEAVTIDLDKDDVSTIDDQVEDQATDVADESVEAKDTETTADNTDGSDQEQASSDEAENGSKTNEASETKADEQPAAHENKKSTGSVFTAGLLGAVLALVGGASLQWADLLPSPNSGQSEISTSLSQRIASLEESTAAFNEQLNQPILVEPTGAVTALATRMDDLETLVQNDNSSSLSALGELNTRIDQLSSQVTNIELAAPISGDGTTALPAGLQEEISNLVALSASQSSEINALKDIIAANAQSPQLTDETSELMSNLEARLALAEEALAKPNNDVPIARSLAAVSIKNAVERGGVFASEVEAYAQIDLENPVIAELKPIADKGVLTRSELINRFGDVANQIIASQRPETSETNLMARLLDSASAMVKVRQVGDVDGESVEAIVARMETRLQSGDLQAALAEWQTLSDTAKAVSQSYSNQLQDRISAETLADQLLQARPATAG